MPGKRQVGLDERPAGAVERRAERRDERRRRDARRPRAPCAAVDALARSGRTTPSRVDADDARLSRTSTPRRAELTGARSRDRSRGYGGSTRSAASTTTIRARRSGRWPGTRRASVCARSRPASPAQLDAGRARRRRRRTSASAPPLARRPLALGALERQQDAPPDLERVLERLEAGREARPTRRGRSSRRARAGRHDQRSRRRASPSRQHDAPRGDVDARRRRPAARARCCLAARRIAGWARAMSRAEQRRGRDLVEQRLEEVVVAAVDQRDAHRRAAPAPWPRRGRRSRRHDHDVVRARCRSCSQRRILSAGHWWGPQTPVLLDQAGSMTLRSTEECARCARSSW